MNKKMQFYLLVKTELTNKNGYIIVRLHKRNENKNEKHLKSNKRTRKMFERKERRKNVQNRCKSRWNDVRNV